MVVEFNMTVPIIFIITYAPTADGEEYLRTGFYQELSKQQTIYEKGV